MMKTYSESVYKFPAYRYFLKDKHYHDAVTGVHLFFTWIVIINSPDLTMTIFISWWDGNLCGTEQES